MNFFLQIMVVQACQVFSTFNVVQQTALSNADPAVPCQVVDPHRNKHIVLRRPHTVLLLATVTGGLAIRGAFTGAIAEVVRRSDGKTDICEMFHKAVDNMSDEEQTPEMRVTTKKLLILPPAVNRNPMATGGAYATGS